MLPDATHREVAVPSSMRVPLLVFGALLVLRAEPAHAQCFFRPSQSCRVFGITEAGVVHRLAPGHVQGYQDQQLSLHLALMGGGSARWAFGGGVFLIGGADVGPAEFPNLRVGVGPRVRYWATRRVAIDVLAGPMLGGGQDTVAGGQIGFLTEASVSFADWAALTMQLERLPAGPVSWSVGVKAGSYPGAVGIAAFILINLIDEYCGSKPGGCGFGY